MATQLLQHSWRKTDLQSPPIAGLEYFYYGEKLNSAGHRHKVLPAGFKLINMVLIDVLSGRWTTDPSVLCDRLFSYIKHYGRALHINV